MLRGICSRHIHFLRRAGLTLVGAYTGTPATAVSMYPISDLSE